MPDWKDDNGEGPVTPDQARARVRQWEKDDKAKIKKGDKWDEATRDDRLDDPKHNEG